MPNLKSPASQDELNWFQRTYSKMINAAVLKNLGAQAPGGVKRDYVPKATDSDRIENIQANLRGVAFRNDWTRVIIPGDDCGCGGAASAASIKKAQDAREKQFRIEASYGRFSQFMVTPTDQERLNNPAQQSFVQQRQLSIPSTTGQFYAFMHAIAAAFGSLDQ
jgi:hypothetical protein